MPLRKKRVALLLQALNLPVERGNANAIVAFDLLQAFESLQFINARFNASNIPHPMLAFFSVDSTCLCCASLFAVLM